MRKAKYVPTPFAFYDRTGICARLEQQARKGWLLEKIGVFGWKYRRIEPQKLRFAVAYCPNISAFDPGDGERELDFREFCAQDGWKFAASSNQMQIFYTEKENPVPLDTDPVLELDNIHKSMKRSMLPVYWLLLLNCAVQLGMQIWRLSEEPVAFLSSNVLLCSLIMMGLLLMILGRELAAYYIWQRKAMKLARENGTFLETKACAGTVAVILFTILGFFVAAMFTMKRSIILTGGITTFFVVAMTLLSALFTQWMKQQKISREDNRNYTILAAVALAFGMLIVSENMVMELPKDWRDEPVINLGGDDVFSGQMPITLEDLGGEEGTDTSLLIDVSFSFLAERAVYRQDSWHQDRENLTLRYVVLQLKWGALKDICLEDFLDMYEYEKMSEPYRSQFSGRFVECDCVPWGADQAWQLERNGERQPEYLLVFGNRIVNFQCFRELTPEEMTVIGNTLGNEQKNENNKNK